jgi:HEAT repeat protein
MAAAVGLSAAGALAQKAGAQPQTAAEKDQQAARQTMIRDFIHYVRTANYDVAAGMGRALQLENLKPTEFVDLVEAAGEGERFPETVGRALRVPTLEPAAAALLKLYDRGKLERVRDADEIKKNIEFLTKTERARFLAHERLYAAGEYAMPQLLQALLQRNDAALSADVQGLLIDMRSQALMPLCTALVKLDLNGQEQVADILGKIEHKPALPFLQDVLLSTSSESVKRACERAIGRIGAGPTSDVADLYEDLGESYYAEKPEITSFPGEEYQILWAYNPAIGLVPTAIRTEVYHEAMAMRMAERSLELRGQPNEKALSLWLASNFSREIQTPAEYDNPAYPKTRREAMYFAVAAGAGPSQSVLARALDTRYTPLARKAIAAIEQTAGTSALTWAGESQRSPLLESLRYPNRRVQYEAALAMGKAQPQRAFPGSERVVPILAGAIRDAGARFAAVVASDKELGNTYRKALEKAGYTVLPVATQMSELAEPIAVAPGVDLIVTNLNDDPTNALIADARRSPKLGVTPVLALVQSPSIADMQRKYDRDVLVAIRNAGLAEPQIIEAVKQLVDSSVGGAISADEARGYAARSLNVLRDLAVSGNTVFDVGEATLPLIAALGETGGKTRLDIAEVLSRVDQKRAQVALFDTALNAQADDRVALLNKVADSAKRYGNLLEDRQVQRLLELAATGPDKEATAAAAVVGSLNLSNANLIPLILEKKG